MCLSSWSWLCSSVKMANANNKRAALLNIILERARKRRKMTESMLHILVNRRMHLIKLATILILISVAGRNAVTPPRRRSCRRLARNTGWWNLIWTTYSNARFKKTFRVTRETFMFILDRIRHVLERQTLVEQPVSPELRLAICLYRLGRGSYYYTIAEMSGLGLSTVSTITKEVSQAIVDILWEETINKHMPHTKQEFTNKIVDMEEMWQFPCCWAAIDGCHIPIKCPPGGQQASKEYHNFKNFYSVVLMAMVDSHYRFIWGSCGYPGNSHDAIIFRSTDLWSNIHKGDYFPQISKKVGSQNVPPLLLGDSAFPFAPWLMKPYTNAVLTERQTYFNYRLSRARMVTEGAYGQLKGRWRVLLRKCESSSVEVRTVTLACMVLHNICIAKGDTIAKKFDLSVDPSSNGKRDRETVRELLQMRECSKIKDSSKEGEKIRDALAEKLWSEKETGYIS